MPIELFFPTPIYIDCLPQSVMLDCQNEIEAAIDHYKEEDLTNPWGDTVYTSFKYNQEVNFLKKTPILQTQIEKHLQNFINALQLNYTAEIKESWFNISLQDHYQHFHIHDTFDFSGVYYHKTNENDGDIVFANPSLASRMSKLTSKVFGMNKISPKAGRLLIFPSFLQHAVYQNITNHARISVTFNGNLQ